MVYNNPGPEKTPENSSIKVLQLCEKHVFRALIEAGWQPPGAKINEPVVGRYGDCYPGLLKCKNILPGGAIIKLLLSPLLGKSTNKKRVFVNI